MGLRLFLPAEWTADPERCAAAGVRFGLTLADAGYGASAAFRQGLSERGLTWAVGIPRTQKVYGTAVRLRWPRSRTGRPRKTPVPSEEPRAVEEVLAGAGWRRLSWRRGTKGPLACGLASRWPMLAMGQVRPSGRG